MHPVCDADLCTSINLVCDRIEPCYVKIGVSYVCATSCQTFAKENEQSVHTVS